MTGGQLQCLPKVLFSLDTALVKVSPRQKHRFPFYVNHCRFYRSRGEFLLTFFCELKRFQNEALIFLGLESLTDRLRLSQLWLEGDEHREVGSFRRLKQLRFQL